MMVHACNPSTWEAEAGGFLSSRPAWTTEWVPGQPRLHRETLSQKNKKTKNKQTNKNKKQKNLSLPRSLCVFMHIHMVWTHVCHSVCGVQRTTSDVGARLTLSLRSLLGSFWVLCLILLFFFFLFSFSFSFSFCPCAQETKQAHDSPPHISTQEPWDFRYTLWCQLYMSSWNLNSVPHACKASILSTERPPQAKTVVFQHVSSYLGLHCNEF